MAFAERRIGRLLARLEQAPCQSRIRALTH
jgi:hypothetical protein